MATEMKMPQLSDTMHQGKILSWRKKEGDPVARGEALAEVETDKANLEIECFTPGILLKILSPAGTMAKVGEVIAIIGQVGETVTTPARQSPTAAPMATSTQSSALAQQQSAQAQRPAGRADSASTPNSGLSNGMHLAPAPESGGRVRVSPLARKLAEQHAVDLSVIHGSGPEGRIVKRDIEARMGSAGTATPSYSQKVTPFQPSGRSVPPSSAPSRTLASVPSGTSSGTGARSYPLSKMRETIARRMQESVTQAPHFYVTAAINMEQAVALREALKERPEYQGISVNHLVIKAVGYALAREPRVNRSMRDGLVFEPDAINVGIITAIEDGLLIPVVRNVDQLPLRDVVFEAKAAIDRARAGRPSSSDLSGGTFSISNMGMFDVENFTAIISPGQGGVLAVSAVREEPVVKNGQIVIGKRMKVTLSVDHRVIDGIMGAQWLKYFKEALEIPALLMN